MTLLPLLLSAADAVPSDNSVVQGPWGALVFVFLVLAVIFLGWSFVRQLRKAQKSADEGKFDE